MDTLLRNLRYAIRVLARTPSFTIIAVLTLAVGIGANSAVFSVLDTVLLRPLPFPDAERLVRLTQAREFYVPPNRLTDWDRLSSTFKAITGYSTEDVSDTTSDRPEELRRATVMPHFVEVWGIAPALGRGFMEDEHRVGAASVALVSDRYWRNRLGADPNVLGRTIRFDNQPYLIVGVMPASFLFPDREVDVWRPHPLDAPFYAQNRDLGSFLGVGRLEAGVTMDAARADLEAVQTRLAEQYPDSDAEIDIRAEPLKDTVVGSVRGSLWLLFGAVSVLLLIASTNIASLLLARTARRHQETAVRFSLGASRAAVTAQLLTESALLALAGAGAGLLLAVGASTAVRTFGPQLPRLDEVGVNARIFLYTLASAGVVTLLCGVFPALRTARGAGSLIQLGRGQVSARHSLQWLLVGVQVALSVTLLAGAALLLRSADALSRVDPGFDPAQVLTFRVTASFAEPGGVDARIQRINNTVDELIALPGVEAAAASGVLPGVGVELPTEFEPVEGRAESEPRMLADRRAVTPGYFEALQIPLVAGELCRLDAGGQHVMVNRSFADRYLAGRSVIGLELRDALGGFPSRITGVVGDARDIATGREAAPAVYYCYSGGVASPWFLIRTSSEPAAAAGAVRARLNELEPLRAVFDIAPLTERIGDVYAPDRLRMALLVFFAATALSLACLGVYGTLNYVVSLREREVGLRVALGAVSRNIVWHFLLNALRIVGLACAAGLLLSLAVTRVLSGMLYGVAASDPTTLSAVVVVVAVVAAVAALLPAVRASRIDPMKALREE